MAYVPRLYLGIDPGKSGGLVRLTGYGFVKASAMPATERDIWDWFTDLPQQLPIGDTQIVAVIEKVGGYLGPGTAAPGSAMFNFGWNYGGLRMALIAAGIPFDEVTPQKWQKALGIGSRKKTESKTQFKNRLKAKAQQLFPQIGVTLKTADALLLAEYCRRMHELKSSCE